MRTAPSDQRVQVRTASAGLPSSGNMTPSLSATRPAHSSPHSTTVLRSADKSLPASCARHGLSLRKRIASPLSRRASASSKSMWDGTLAWDMDPSTRLVVSSV